MPPAVYDLAAEGVFRAVCVLIGRGPAVCIFSFLRPRNSRLALAPGLMVAGMGCKTSSSAGARFPNSGKALYMGETCSCVFIPFYRQKKHLLPVKGIEAGGAFRLFLISISIFRDGSRLGFLFLWVFFVIPLLILQRQRVFFMSTFVSISGHFRAVFGRFSAPPPGMYSGFELCENLRKAGRRSLFADPVRI